MSRYSVSDSYYVRELDGSLNRLSFLNLLNKLKSPTFWRLAFVILAIVGVIHTFQVYNLGTHLKFNSFGQFGSHYAVSKAEMSNESRIMELFGEIYDLKRQIAELNTQNQVCRSTAQMFEDRLKKVEKNAAVVSLASPADQDVVRFIDDKIEAAIAKYDGDKTGRADFAVVTGGGVILSNSPAFEGYYEAYSFMGFQSNKRYSDPRVIITPGNLPGSCWAMNGTSGFVTIRLRESIRVTGLSYEHVHSRLVSPRDQKSAPRTFSVFSMMSEVDRLPDLVGEYEYLLEESPTIQLFHVEKPITTSILKFEFTSNYGDDRYTCLYRIRVHGEIDDS